MSGVEIYTDLLLKSHSTKNLLDAKDLWRHARIVWSALSKEERKEAMVKAGKLLLENKIKLKKS